MGLDGSSTRYEDVDPDTEYWCPEGRPLFIRGEQPDSSYFQGVWVASGLPGCTGCLADGGRVSSSDCDWSVMTAWRVCHAVLTYYLASGSSGQMAGARHAAATLYTPHSAGTRVDHAGRQAGRRAGRQAGRQHCLSAVLCAVA